MCEHASVTTVMRSSKVSLGSLNSCLTFCGVTFLDFREVIGKMESGVTLGQLVENTYPKDLTDPNKYHASKKSYVLDCLQILASQFTTTEQSSFGAFEPAEKGRLMFSEREFLHQFCVSDSIAVAFGAGLSRTNVDKRLDSPKHLLEEHRTNTRRAGSSVEVHIAQVEAKRDSVIQTQSHIQSAQTHCTQAR